MATKRLPMRKIRDVLRLKANISVVKSGSLSKLEFFDPTGLVYTWLT